MRSRYGVTWFCALIQREKGGFTSVFRDGVKVQSRQVFEPLCDTNTRGRAQLAEVKERTDGVCFRVCLWGARVECRRV